MDTRIGRAARKTDLRSRMAINAIGPRPERAPSAPLPFMESRDPGPNAMGLFAGLASSGASAFGTYASLKAPSPGDVPGGIDYGQNFGTNANIPAPKFGGDLGATGLKLTP